MNAETRHTGNERFSLSGKPTNRRLLGFWQWAFSDLVGNIQRGRLAEYIVALAIDQEEWKRKDWDPFDLVTKNGIRLEVKSAAYIQSWPQPRPSPIRFGIAPTHAWEPETGRYHSKCERQADVYVFCLLHHLDRDSVDPLNLDQWKFYILPTEVLNNRAAQQRGISLSSLLKLGPANCGFNELEAGITETFQFTNHSANTKRSPDPGR